MPRIKLTIEVEIDESAFPLANDDEILWLENEILVGDGNLILHSNEIGDSVGVVKSVKNICYINKK